MSFDDKQSTTLTQIREFLPSIFLQVVFGVKDDAVGLAIVDLMKIHCTELAKAEQTQKERSAATKVENEQQRIQLLRTSSATLVGADVRVIRPALLRSGAEIDSEIVG
eukprot:SAG31_NODE_18822_length_621_cov_1.369732_1_plen_107_part_10